MACLLSAVPLGLRVLTKMNAAIVEINQTCTRKCACTDALQGETIKERTVCASLQTKINKQTEGSLFFGSLLNAFRFVTHINTVVSDYGSTTSLLIGFHSIYLMCDPCGKRHLGKSMWLISRRLGVGAGDG